MVIALCQNSMVIAFYQTRQLATPAVFEHLSTSPEVEPPSFVVQVRATLKYIQQNPFPGITVFPDNRPHFYQKDETGNWVRVCY
ncbi:hypothetical protein AVEN_252210-1 [Araneus ventricosus]|uniref:Uncharacterized protein n=1 Tax=Araneus ventricosus TaxID=182803 RepID=A0A4Y2LTQ7_ARAVE|nr:hypothetical protein AVEN_252210-1 [Araneus ventricosus]